MRSRESSTDTEVYVTNCGWGLIVHRRGHKYDYYVMARHIATSPVIDTGFIERAVQICLGGAPQETEGDQLLLRRFIQQL